MSRRNRLSRDQKRHQKLAKQSTKGGSPVAAYQGNTYRSEKFVKVIFEAEVGIHEADVVNQNGLSDREVFEALEDFILELRGERPPVSEDEPGGLVAFLIKGHWRDLFAGRPRPSADDLTGCLQTILASIDHWTTRAQASRGYLDYLRKFMKKAGVRCRLEKSTRSEETDAEDDPPEGEHEETPVQDDGDQLCALGQAWLKSRAPKDFEEFRAECGFLVDSGDANLVIDVCEELREEAHDPLLLGELQKIIAGAEQGESPALKQSWLGWLLGRPAR